MATWYQTAFHSVRHCSCETPRRPGLHARAACRTSMDQHLNTTSSRVAGDVYAEVPSASLLTGVQSFGVGRQVRQSYVNNEERPAATEYHIMLWTPCPCRCIGHLHTLQIQITPSLRPCVCTDGWQLQKFRAERTRGGSSKGMCRGRGRGTPMAPSPP
jgi:hypothetical protein